MADRLQHKEEEKEVKEVRIKKMKSGFTLVEILIVVVILGILAAIVMPQFSDSSEQSKMSSLTSDLQTVRSQIQLYKAQHHHGAANLPGTVSGISFAQAMTMYTKQDGTLAAAQAPGSDVCGPYLLEIPENPYNESNSVSSGTTAGDGSTGWWYNKATGDFKANDSAGHAGL